MAVTERPGLNSADVESPFYNRSYCNQCFQCHDLLRMLHETRDLFPHIHGLLMHYHDLFLGQSCFAGLYYLLHCMMRNLYRRAWKAAGSLSEAEAGEVGER